MQRIRLDPKTIRIAAELKKLGCSRPQIQKHLSALRHLQEKKRIPPKKPRMDDDRPVMWSTW